ncbi:Fusarisetin A cluster transcription factor [Lachnellula hyalina]|uniref:Fusarisetin A cluster transcription factor n=1 Tax=Lachnellula hyalina TaxID=1316788 RepID=A0A8H8U2M9_9HELO|nr:Fusarisetin A cluster transcription factor [Lachnellula hyalina]TVY29152.1 Fusarisetin A cluster transcription factor [Lachnellula hyalina]
MAQLSNLTGKFRINGNASHTSKVTKRPRETLVCLQCKASKLRCDRGQPCSGCLKRDVACSYHKSTLATDGAPRNTVAEDRLLHLESMVKSLMQERVQSGNSGMPENTMTPPENTPPAHDPSEHLDQSRGELINNGNYVGSTHWSAILDDIQELRLVLGGSTDIPESEGDLAAVRPSVNSEVIFGSSSKYSVQQIVSQHLPPKVEVDRALSFFFRGETFIVPFIHTYYFQRQYRDFWADPANVNPLWLSMLFSVCYISSLMGGTSGPQQSWGSERSALHSASGQCLVLGKYHRPQKFAVEALGIYGHCKNLQSLETSREAGSILSMVVRMAYEMGYHRDPDKFGSFTVFEGEMRRRCWASLRQMDVMISFQLGLPSSICLDNCDTKSPRNLLDSDFDEDTKVLPESRPENEPTRLLWFIVKVRVMANFGEVCQDALSFKEKSEAEIVQLDKEIRQTYRTVPEVLRSRPISESITDAPFLIMTRLYIDLIHLKCVCILHRKYMARGNLFSTISCVEAGTKMVSQFLDIYKEFAPGGQLYMERWMLNNFTMNDFLLGVMVLCLVVHTRWKKGPQNSSIDAATESEVLGLLRQCHTVCVEKSASCRDARRVSYAILLTLNGAKGPKTPAIQTTRASSSDIQPTVGESQAVDPVSLLQPCRVGSVQTDEAAFGLLDPFNFMGSDADNMDWTLFDSQFFAQDVTFVDGFVPG